MRNANQSNDADYISKGRLNSEETARKLGFNSHDIPILIAAGHLIPLGKPADNAPKYFAEVRVRELQRDERWLFKATETIRLYWRKRNDNRKRGNRKPLSAVNDLSSIAA